MRSFHLPRRLHVANLGPLLLILASLLVNSAAGMQQAAPPHLLVPIGGGTSAVYTELCKTALANAHQNQLKILVLPLGMSSKASEIQDSELKSLLDESEQDRREIETICSQITPPSIQTQVELAPIFTRADAIPQASLQYFTPDLSAVFILGEDPGMVMEVIGGTPIEQALDVAYQRGVIIAGTSGGGTVQSVAMLRGYSPNFSASNALDFGAVDLWHSAEKHGFLFGLQDAIIDQNFYQDGHFGRLLNAISLPEAPQVGIGLDALTGVRIQDGKKLQDVFGPSVVTVLDAHTYHAAEGVQYHGEGNTLSLRNVIVNLIAPGESSYDLSERGHSLGYPEPVVERNFESLVLPDGAGPLILTGDLSGSLDDSPILQKFVELCGGESANILVIAAGYTNSSAAGNAASEYAGALDVVSQTTILPAGSRAQLDFPPGYTGILIVGSDPSGISPETLARIKSAWLRGTPLLVDDGAVGLAGAYYHKTSALNQDASSEEQSIQPGFLPDDQDLAPGLDLLNINFEPDIMASNHLPRLFSLAYNHPDLLSIGLSSNTALILTKDGQRVLGKQAAFVLDLRKAALGRGSQGGYVIANGLLDVFATGDEVLPQTADIHANPLRAATPLPPTPTPTLTPQPTATLQPTPTPTDAPPEPTPTKVHRPTPTPPVIPPPTNMSTTNLMVLLGVLIVIVVLIGVLLNYQRVF